MNVNELQEALDALPKKLHDMYGFQISPAAINSGGAVLSVGKPVRGNYAEIWITDDLQMLNVGHEVHFRNDIQWLYISTENYFLYEYRR